MQPVAVSPAPTLETFEWSPLFETGLTEVDAQHKRLVELVNQLGADVDSASPEHIDQALQTLAEYTVYHFQCEEAIMDAGQVATVYADRHRDTHRRFIKQVSDWLARRTDGEAISLHQLLDFLANWLIFHILGDDQSLGRQIAAINQGADPAAAFAQDRTSDDPRTDILLGSLRRLYGDLVARNEELLVAQQSLSSLNITLEQRVTERTAELREANRLLREEQDKLIDAEKMASLGRMVAGFAHEINTPVGVAVGAVSYSAETLDRIDKMLANEEVDEHELRAELDELRHGGTLALSNLTRAANLVQSFKRSSIDQASEQVRDFAVKELISDVLFSLHSELKRLPLNIEVSCPDDLHLEGIPGLLNQVLNNLVMNAVQHAFEDAAHQGKIVIDAVAEDGHVRIVFADDGIGMTADQLARIFEPFFTTKRGSGGSGLGLYICYEIITVRLGGTIYCESEPGAGCRFVIDFPAQFAEPRDTWS